ncbi:hypothetical protein L6452_02726 [Arctium lappa]|uniref:Uncharacterized protein n=1 Tax=Arctium lappa TaxID=4217 RepID=A0ACB9FKQ9_ARCLA|nr:hypothetical protein L6452_02726 [Arctium lappa]
MTERRKYQNRLPPRTKTRLYMLTSWRPKRLQEQFTNTHTHTHILSFSKSKMVEVNQQFEDDSYGSGGSRSEIDETARVNDSKE